MESCVEMLSPLIYQWIVPKLKSVLKSLLSIFGCLLVLGTFVGLVVLKSMASGLLVGEVECYPLSRSLSAVFTTALMSLVFLSKLKGRNVCFGIIVNSVIV